MSFQSWSISIITAALRTRVAGVKAHRDEANCSEVNTRQKL
jgi:hypothetical protein